MGTPLALYLGMNDYYHDSITVRRGPSPGLAAVLSVLIPGLGQVYNGKLIAGAIWFLATSLGYSAIILPGFVIHAASVWCAYRGAQSFAHY
jgi:TM2 domain-containing membrane protein YozV